MKPVTFTETVALYEKMIKNQMKKLCIYRDYEEYYQCGLIALWRAYDKYDEKKGSFPAYALVTVRGYLLAQLKKERRFQDRETCTEQYILESISGEEKRMEVFEYMSMLEENERFVLFEHFYGGKKMHEIADELGMTYHQARWIYRQALKKIRAHAVEK
ncbi:MULTISPECIES: sigma-70 family RNA polymerase sigma factor [unclassified Bacillus (in: firmicutes)]|uniref:sigma-70 family RNA polymerase sigma factor n=1 Tax=unclassified Bacillus (in: firmicutes) TaxID=185979 RepID=UPI0008E1258F|nr:MULTISPECIES: sigma-70 family RNA polymerase sigma factor [unclassified Bacillus (in: firmicutes)]SFJ68934.1 DNA-directed RNA polymerase [Bacillus sp. 71mf]SFT20688.1 DNA-directed RNA polymerase [Bacillus sp. 103mf]